MIGRKSSKLALLGVPFLAAVFTVFRRQSGFLALLSIAGVKVLFFGSGWGLNSRDYNYDKPPPPPPTNNKQR